MPITKIITSSLLLVLVLPCIANAAITATSAGTIESGQIINITPGALVYYTQTNTSTSPQTITFSCTVTSANGTNQSFIYGMMPEFTSSNFSLLNASATGSKNGPYTWIVSAAQSNSMLTADIRIEPGVTGTIQCKGGPAS